MKLEKIKKPALIASVALLAMIGSTAAFLTSRDSADNSFRIAKVDLEIKEDFKADKPLSAGEKITKRPWIKNTGNVDQLFFVEIYVPCMEATFLDSKGNRIAPSGTTPTTAAGYRQMGEIFNLIATNSTEHPIAYITQPTTTDGKTQNFELSYHEGSNSILGWHYIKQTSIVFNNEPGFQDGTYNAYLLGYNSVVEPGNTTIAIFDQLQLRSIIDADIENESIGQVTIRAHTIQADELNISDLTGNGTEGHFYTSTDLAKIYNIFENKTITAQGGVSP